MRASRALALFFETDTTMKASSAKRSLCLLRDFPVLQLLLCLLVSGAAVEMAGRNSAQPNDEFRAFWARFKTAVIAKDKKTVAALSRFPLTMSNGAANIADRAELARRFGDLFERDTNAAQCFASKEPTIDTESSNRYSIACPNKDDNFVVYEFERSGTDWKFVHREFPTKCGCR
ncbi:MAG: hypothetical protein DMF72_04380 [Acidobacteria bacterium]|nr:MAG: hypothetical protein DMF72_04380 [Acidobacteriota bacterium]